MNHTTGPIRHYWVYVNQPNNKALIHDSTCPFCDDGRGMTNDKLAHNGQWLGPFDESTAVRKAKAVGKKTTRWCSQCARRLGIDGVEV
jgi:hypothetical protein